MTTNVSKYIARNSAANPRYANAGGYGNGTLANSPGMTGRKPIGWNANGGGNALPTADPYMFQISNASPADVLVFNFLDASNVLYGGAAGTFSAAGDYTERGVTISMTSGGINYRQFLGNLNGSPFTAGMVYLQSTAGSAQQINDTYQLSTTSPEGAVYTKPIKPFLSPDQFQSGVLVNNTAFNVNTLTKLTWGKIYASAVFQFIIWPSQTINLASPLNGQNAQQVNGAPRVVGSLR